MVVRRIVEYPDNVTFYCWQIFEKKIDRSKADVTFKDAVEMFKDDIKTLREHIRIKREQINANHEIKSSFSENNLMLHADFAESYKNDQQLPYKVRVSKIKVLAYLQRVATLKELIITMLEVLALSLLPKVPTTTESCL